MSVEGRITKDFREKYLHGEKQHLPWFAFVNEKLNTMTRFDFLIAISDAVDKEIAAAIAKATGGE